VSLTYLNGDTCQLSDGSYIRRNITLHMFCQPKAGMWNVNNVTIFESPMCSYHVILYSKAGCPTECPWGENSNGLGTSICTGNGVCDYDDTNGYAKCFCNEGWSGNDCSVSGAPTPPPLTSHAGAIVGFLFLGVVLGVAIGGGAFYYFVVMKGVAPTGFAQLGGGGGGGGAGVQSGVSQPVASSAAGGGYAPPPAGDSDDNPML
jgi:hypothetical protein